jgi:Phage integrase family
VFDAAASAVGKESMTPHELRHTCASLAISAGANVKVLQKLLGHKTATLTLDRYGHLFPDDLDSVPLLSTWLPKLLRTNCGLARNFRRPSPRRMPFDVRFPVPPVGLEPTLCGF